MITIKNYMTDDKNQVTADLNASYSYSTKIALVQYIDYTKGDEDNLTITFDAYAKYLDGYYPISYEDTATTVAPVTKVFDQSGKYRIIITGAENEEGIRTNATLVNGGSSAGTANIVIAPASTMI